jgi:hypothetical protein
VNDFVLHPGDHAVEAARGHSADSTAKRRRRRAAAGNETTRRSLMQRRDHRAPRAAHRGRQGTGHRASPSPHLEGFTQLCGSAGVQDPQLLAKS